MDQGVNREITEKQNPILNREDPRFKKLFVEFCERHKKQIEQFHMAHKGNKNAHPPIQWDANRQCFWWVNRKTRRGSK